MTPTVGDTFVALLDDQINFERTRKASLEARGLAVITTSGALVTLLLGLAALITKAQTFAPSLATRVLLIAAVAAFLAAATLGIYCNAPLHYRELEPTSLKTLTTIAVWTAPGDQAQREIAVARLESLTAARSTNEAKARGLLIAIAVQVLAVALTAIASAVVLAQG